MAKGPVCNMNVGKKTAKMYQKSTTVTKLTYVQPNCKQ